MTRRFSPLKEALASATVAALLVAFPCALAWQGKPDRPVRQHLTLVPADGLGGQD